MEPLFARRTYFGCLSARSSSLRTAALNRPQMPSFPTISFICGHCRRLLFACFPLPAIAILTWAGVALGGAAYAAPCVSLLMYAAVGLYAVPLRSALGGGGAGGVRMPAAGLCNSGLSGVLVVASFAIESYIFSCVFSGDRQGVLEWVLHQGAGFQRIVPAEPV